MPDRDSPRRVLAGIAVSLALANPALAAPARNLSSRPFGPEFTGIEAAPGAPTPEPTPPPPASAAPSPPIAPPAPAILKPAESPPPEPPPDDAAAPWAVGAFVDTQYIVNSNFPDNHIMRGTAEIGRAHV